MRALPIRLAIKSIYGTLSPKDKIIADYILDNPEKIAHGTISDAAKDLDIADSTFFQFTRKLGFNGFKDFKISLLMEGPAPDNSISIHENISKIDNELTMATKVFESNMQTLRDSMALLSQEKLEKAADILFRSKIVQFFGVGGSEMVASDAFHKFLRSPIRVIHTVDYHLQLMEAALLTEDDCAFLISHSGLTIETIRLAKIAKKNKAKLIVITSQAHSELATLADVAFISTAEETAYRSEALSSRITQLSIIDSLYVILMYRDEDAAAASLKKVRSVIQNSQSKV